MADKDRDKLLNYILQPELSIHNPLPDIIPRTYDANRLLHLPKGSACTKLVPLRDFLTGKVKEFVEVDLEDVGANAINSTSMRREPGLLEEMTRGSAMNYPFWPGGFDEPQEEITKLNEDVDFDFGSELLTVPPGFQRGYDFGAQTETESTLQESPNAGNVNLLKNLETDLDVQQWLQMTQTETETDDKPAAEMKGPSGEFRDLDEQILKSNLTPVLELSTAKTPFHSEWAEMVDISQPMTDFKERIPCPAKEFPFELDEFQKQAIVKLEERKYVFVAAHTSAGKTVVAEYAIALSQRDLTRTIYTSPIKALSNQKYRDFKATFDDVGLITGDFQIDPTASCLIMTTEILRSMLYCGSDITRDLEYVIFDEVHYINNPERGHVWEEVIILLPDHVNIIMLSATVPNTIELADWVGNTKKRKVYVITTPKRPVPLMHYLYTGAENAKTSNLFLVVDKNGKFLEQNYKAAEISKKELLAKSKGGFGGGGRGGGGHGGSGGGGGGGGGGAKKFANQRLKVAVRNADENNKGKKKLPTQDKNMWQSLIAFLKQSKLMPVVAFTLSRQRCDENVNALYSLDLNTSAEKRAVERFFRQCVTKLKPCDRQLPQVMNMMCSLERGIGVHHSGILPILREIVEMLFQSGLVKILFATETFAMGVNMPARTVIFDSHRKFDGVEVRNLKPGEYIQMAGRAGRRQYDDVGTVILLCKHQVPPIMDLRPMILGQPEKLQSQFILRYAVILTCLRIESIKVEDIMQFTFKEFKLKLKKSTHEKQLQVAENNLTQLPELGDHLAMLCQFYELSHEYLVEKQRLMKFLLPQSKELKPGRVLLVTHGLYNKLGILLTMKMSAGKETIYRVLVLDHQFPSSEHKEIINRGEFFHKMLSLTPRFKHFHPEGSNGHTILDVTAGDIVEVTKTTIKLIADVIINNWEQRQIERFKYTLPGASVVKAVSELQQLNDNYIAKPETIKFVDLSQDININDISDVQRISHVEHLQRQLNTILPHTNIIDIESEFVSIYERKMLEHRIEELKFKNSIKNLSLYPDYCSKLEVLRALKYIDENEEVTLKGKIACEMGQNELLITELILCNMFNDLQPAEIAALLSGLVFHGKVADDDDNENISLNLKKCVNEFEAISNRILKEELKHHAIMEMDSRLNFGLLAVVYEWACQKPFAEIMKLTDVQEGVIVRCIVQLAETLRDVKTAAIRIGNPALQTKMEEASNAIKRDIVFTASLYMENVRVAQPHDDDDDDGDDDDNNDGDKVDEDQNADVDDA